MTEPLPEFAPLPTAARLRVIRPDGPSAVSAEAAATVSAVPSMAPDDLVRVAASPLPPDAPADAPADARTVSADAPAVNETEAVSVTDASVTPVTDADAADADGDILLPEIASFGEEINPATLFVLTAARATMSITAAGMKGAAKSKTWTSPPQSPGGHHAWVKDTGWIPDDLGDEGMIKLLAFLRKAWGWTLGMVFTVLGNAIVWLRLPQHFILASAAGILLYMFVIR